MGVKIYGENVSKRSVEAVARIHGGVSNCEGNGEQSFLSSSCLVLDGRDMEGMWGGSFVHAQVLFSERGRRGDPCGG